MAEDERLVGTAGHHLELSVTQHEADRGDGGRVVIQRLQKTVALFLDDRNKFTVSYFLCQMNESRCTYLIDAEDVDESITRGGSEKPHAGFGSRVLEAQHLGVVSLDFIQLVHELHVVNPVRRRDSRQQCRQKKTTTINYSQLLRPSLNEAIERALAHHPDTALEISAKKRVLHKEEPLPRKEAS